MSQDLEDALPPPIDVDPADPSKIQQDTLEIGRGENGGWFVTINNERLLVCRSSIAEIADWLKATFGPLDRPIEDLEEEDRPTRPANRRKSLFTGWRRDVH